MTTDKAKSRFNGHISKVHQSLNMTSGRNGVGQLPQAFNTATVPSPTNQFFQ